MDTFWAFLVHITGSPVMVALASAVAFLAGLVLRPYLEARSGLFREAALARRRLQRDTLVELQAALHSLDQSIAFEPLDYDPATAIRAHEREMVDIRKMEMLVTVVRDERVRHAIAAYLAVRGGPGTAEAIDAAHEAIGNALRRL